VAEENHEPDRLRSDRDAERAVTDWRVRMSAKPELLDARRAGAEAPPPLWHGAGFEGRVPAHEQNLMLGRGAR
jgi:hypothetical protein